MKPQLLSLAAVTLIACSSATCAAGFDESSVLLAVESVVAEHRTYATCLALDPLSYQIAQENWMREVKQSAETLKNLDASPGFMARFAVAVNPARLLDEDMTLSAAMAYCKKNEAQVRKFHEFGFSRLSTSVDQVAKRASK